ncbi:MAG: cytochrome c oxidase subunit 3 [Rhodopirellula sp.]|nr:cytochrome c oxidase subunit 3 [Rhodopirellula sp.]
MWTRESRNGLNRFLQRRSNLALCFFLLSAVTLAVSIGGAWLMIAISSFVPTENHFLFPPAFAASTILLLLGSVTLQTASYHVRCERQRLFRRRMLQSLFVGIAFVIFQTQGLWCLLPQKAAAQRIGLRDGAFAFALMHGIHFIVALLFVAFVLLQALADRYDHEYSWGVTFCAWFWHALGIVWLVIVAGFVLAAVAPV